MIHGCPMGRFCHCDNVRRGACKWSPPAPSPDAAEHAAALDARRQDRAELARAIRSGRALPAAGDLFGERSALTGDTREPAAPSLFDPPTD